MEPRDIAEARNSGFGAPMRPPSVRIKRLPPKERDTLSRQMITRRGVAFSAPEKPPDGCPPAARREGRIAAQWRRKLVETRSRTLLGDSGYDSDAMREHA